MTNRGLTAAAVLAGALVVTGCATQPHQETDLQWMQRQAAEAPLLCQTAEQCALYWRRAQIWVTTNSRMAIRTVTDTIIETFPAPGVQAWRYYQVLRIPGQPGAPDRITIGSGCNNLFGCDKTELQAAAEFKAFVRGQ